MSDATPIRDMECDVAIIGAGPAGALAAAVLADKGWNVRVFERQHFPRFSIGESLLPQSMEYLEAAGLLGAVEAEGFQFKDGAAFACGEAATSIYFPDKSAPGWGTTFQVRRDRFDKALIDAAEARGASVRFGDTVESFQGSDTGARLGVVSEAGDSFEVRARFVLDGSGFGRVLPRLLDLHRPSDFSPRRSVFRHVTDRISDAEFDRNKILISVHPENQQIWYWLIPLADGLSSIGAVGPDDEIEAYGANPEERLDALVGQSGRMADLLREAVTARPAGEIRGYAAAVTQLTGPGYALLGNAAEFLDPVFSSGVTIALKSATLATDILDRQLRGQTVDWQADFVDELLVGVETFRACVSAWYDGSLQRIIFNRPASENRITAYLTSVLAGYAWDRDNPLVREPERFLRVVDEVCRQPE